MKDSGLFGRVCYFSDGTARKTTQFDDCLPHYDVSSPLLDEIRTDSVLLCAYEGDGKGEYVHKKLDETCPRYITIQKTLPN
jgi:hypothetical protein